MPSDVLNIEQIQRLEFEMLRFLNSVCSEAGIEYCLAYGSALGAHRHGGFIPWDDDMDVYVKRTDCDNLFNLLDKRGNGRYLVFRPCETEGYNHPYAKLVDCSTAIEEPKNNPVEKMGIFIDFFPCDFHNSAGLLVKARIKLVNILNKVYCQAYVRNHRDASVAVRCFWKTIAKVISSEQAHFAIERLAQRKSALEGDYISCPYDSDYIIPSNWIFPPKEEFFEGWRCPIPGEIEHYLEAMYGPDYMTPRKTEDAYHGLARMREYQEQKENFLGKRDD